MLKTENPGSCSGGKMHKNETDRQRFLNDQKEAESMKKRLSVIFGLCIILSTMTVQAETIPDSVKNQKMSGQILQELNIIKGTENGLEEDKPVNRE